MNNFDRIAPVYDILSRLVFGRHMHKAQTLFLHRIQSGGNVLMLGGGTGWLLAELMAINPTCRVWYVEASAKMLALSRKRTSSPNVNFIYGTEESIPSGIKFDAVITHFYFDLFTEDFCQKLVIKIHPHIHHNGLWLIADFVNTTWWHGAMLGIMYRFFKVVSGVDVHQLPSWKQVVEKSGFKEVYSKNFFGEFIRSSLFRLK